MSAPRFQLFPSHSLRILGLVTLFAASTPLGFVMAEDEPTPETIGYFLGLSVGQNLAQQGFKPADFTVAGVSKGLADAMSGKEVALGDAQLQAIAKKIEDTLKVRQQAQMEVRKKEGVANLEKSKLFIEENAKKEGVKQLASGLQYKVVTAGTGKSPSAEDTVSVHYVGKLISGDTFDSSVARGEPATFRVGEVIPGWRQALQEMKVGDKWMLYIPPALAYGPQGKGGIGPNELLIFEVELLSIGGK